MFNGMNIRDMMLNRWGRRRWGAPTQTQAGRDTRV